MFFLLLSPIMWFAHTVFLAAPGARRAASAGAARRATTTPCRSRCGARRLWPQTVLGVSCLVVLAIAAPAAIPVALLIAGGLALAVPLCVITAKPAVGAALLRFGIGRLPEETLHRRSMHWGCRPSQLREAARAASVRGDGAT